ncbi:MAG TPA: hypothetical protein VGG75_17310 [Trebonia sp.]
MRASTVAPPGSGAASVLAALTMSVDGFIAPADWPAPDAPFTAVTEGVAAAIGKAKAVAGDKAVALAGPSVIQQALDLGLVDEIAVDLAPVLQGTGIRFFGELAHSPVLLDDPEVIEGTRVTHLRFRVRRG